MVNTLIHSGILVHTLRTNTYALRRTLTYSHYIRTHMAIITTQTMFIRWPS